MNVEQCMSRQPKTCASSDNLARAAQIMWENDCGYVPVLDGRNRLVGVVTDRDVCMAAFMKGAPLHALDVASAMAKKVFTCKPQDAVETAERLMQTYQVRRLPVVDGEDNLVGVLSLADVARALRGAADARTADPLVGELARTLSAISEPRRRGADGAPATEALLAVPREADARQVARVQAPGEGERAASESGSRRRGNSAGNSGRGRAS